MVSFKGLHYFQLESDLFPGQFIIFNCELVFKRWDSEGAPLGMGC
jgi:hypothetical protein